MEFQVDFARKGDGQMMVKERQAMYDTIVKYKPKRLLEIGTWKGGGSTYIISSAASKCGGILDTIETDIENYSYAVKLYCGELVYLQPFVKFNHGQSQDIIPRLLWERKAYDFLFLDGAEDQDQTVKEYNMMNEHLALGSILACHDWGTLKMARLKEIIGADKSWQNIVSITDTDTGFQMFQRRLF
jgi:predicted O-methyltransferase YrrM